MKYKAAYFDRVERKPFELLYDKTMNLFRLAAEGKKTWYTFQIL